MNTMSSLYVLSNSSAPVEMSFTSAMAFAALVAIVVGGALATVVTVIEAHLVMPVQKHQSFLQWLRSRMSLRVPIASADAEPR